MKNETAEVLRAGDDVAAALATLASKLIGAFLERRAIGASGTVVEMVPGDLEVVKQGAVVSGALIKLIRAVTGTDDVPSPVQRPS
jgi:hypothetical protein